MQLVTVIKLEASLASCITIVVKIYITLSAYGKMTPFPFKVLTLPKDFLVIIKFY